VLPCGLEPGIAEHYLRAGHALDRMAPPTSPDDSPLKFRSQDLPLRIGAAVQRSGPPALCYAAHQFEKPATHRDARCPSLDGRGAARKSRTPSPSQASRGASSSTAPCIVRSSCRSIVAAYSIGEMRASRASSISTELHEAAPTFASSVTMCDRPTRAVIGKSPSINLCSPRFLAEKGM